jgi:hypothetical protein
MRARDLLLSTAMLGGTLVVVPVMGADLSVPAPPPAAAPAVDGPNVKVAGLGGTFANRSLSGVVGAYTFPLSTQYGVQIDGGVGRFDSSAWTEIGGHLFWRNPSQALFFTAASRNGIGSAGSTLPMSPARANCIWVVTP